MSRPRRFTIHFKLWPGSYTYEIHSRIGLWLFQKLFVIKVYDTSLTFDFSSIPAPSKSEQELNPEGWPEKVPCIACHGRGYIQVRGVGDNEPCDICGGTGKINKEVR